MKENEKDKKKNRKGTGRGKKDKQKDKGHASDCSVHNGPAEPPGPCDCKEGDQKEEQLPHVVIKGVTLEIATTTRIFKETNTLIPGCRFPYSKDIDGERAIRELITDVTEVVKKKIDNHLDQGGT